MPLLISYPQAAAALKMTLTDPRAVLYAPLSIAFGFARVFVLSFVDAESVKPYLGTYSVGYTGAIQTVSTCTIHSLASNTHVAAN